MKQEEQHIVLLALPNCFTREGIEYTDLTKAQLLDRRLWPEYSNRPTLPSGVISPDIPFIAPDT